jgi:hypothetical protein
MRVLATPTLGVGSWVPLMFLFVADVAVQNKLERFYTDFSKTFFPLSFFNSTAAKLK